jgi:hypothetical protein
MNRDSKESCYRPVDPKANNASEMQSSSAPVVSTVPPAELPRYVTELHPNDILLGRGAPIINYEGNVRFRALVSTRKAEYVSTGRHQVKDDIARQIIQEIERRNGKFLKKVECEAESQRLGIDEDTKAWTIVDDDVAIEKVKQALRDKDTEKRMQDDQSINEGNHHALPDFSNELRSLSMPSFSDNFGWLNGQRSLLQESIRSQSAPSSLAALSDWRQQRQLNQENSTNINQQLVDHYLTVIGQQQRQNLSHLAHISPAPPVGTGYATSEYLQAILRQGNSLTAPHPAVRQVTRESEILALRRQDSSLDTVNFHAGRANDASLLNSIEHSRAPTNPSIDFPSAYSTERKYQDALSNVQLSALKALREQQQIELQRQVLMGSNIRTLEYPSTGGTNLMNNGSRVQNSEAMLAASFVNRLATQTASLNPVARMPFVTHGKGGPESDREEAKVSYAERTLANNDNRKRSAHETEPNSSTTNLEETSRFYDNARGGKHKRVSNK